MGDLTVREYGRGDVALVVLHGGPGAAGDVGALAAGLGARWLAIEPFQRGSGAEPLTVATHVRDLDALIQSRCTATPIVIGHSWGAMLALAHAAEHPASVRAIALIGCGTFTIATRAEYERRREARTTVAERALAARITRTTTLSPERKLAALGRLNTRIGSFDAEPATAGDLILDPRAHEETWSDMVRLQHAGVYPAAFNAIGVPVLMIHGDTDPHPGRLIADDLRVHMPQLEYVELAACGHAPWRERQARDTFFAALGDWIGRIAAREAKA